MFLRLEKNRGRRECRAPNAPAASCAKVESTRVSHHGHAGSPGIPRAMVLTVSFALSPVTGLVCHRRPQETCKKLASRELDASVGASGPHDFAVRKISAFVNAPPASTASRLTSVTIAKRPSVRDGMAKDMWVIWVRWERKYFCDEDWTGGIGLNPKENFLSAVIPRCAIAHLRAHLMAAHSKSVNSYRSIRRAFDERRCHFAKYRGRDTAQLSSVPRFPASTHRVDADQCAFQMNRGT